MKTSLAAFLKDESGATAMEYALIAAGMAVVLITVIGTLSGGLIEGMESIADKMTIE